MSEIPKDAVRCLDKGFVRLVDAMGGDDAIVQAARVSYGKGTAKVSQDRGLIRYLMRHRHTTPFEMVEFKFMQTKKKSFLNANNIVASVKVARPQICLLYTSPSPRD